MGEKIFTFMEPHPTGGDCKVTITESKIIDYMKKIQEQNPKMKDATDEMLLDEFCINHWCYEEKS
jgi:hypothetical protein